MKQFLFILFLFNTTIYISQIRNGIVNYKYKIEDEYIPKEKFKKEKNQKLKINLNFINESLKNNQNKLIFTLKFNKHSSEYSMNKIIEVDIDKQLKYAIIVNRGKQVYYNSLNEKIIIYQTQTWGDQFNVVTNFEELNWELKRETKKIGEYNCFKAILIRNDRIVEAWYTPQVNLRYGPKNYGGLPGLILELKENNITYYVSKLSFNLKKDIDINIPEKNKRISQEDYNRMRKKIKQKLYNRLKN
ncbi:GLPGLI family protein [Polaribacter sp. R77954]|uniref:GLPGLI family protein n=1 Tax=Polaribacter sp. R77954 TaxID=3093870 RepID=UPI0037C64BF5